MKTKVTTDQMIGNSEMNLFQHAFYNIYKDGSENYNSSVFIMYVKDIHVLRDDFFRDKVKMNFIGVPTSDEVVTLEINEHKSIFIGHNIGRMYHYTLFKPVLMRFLMTYSAKVVGNRLEKEYASAKEFMKGNANGHVEAYGYDSKKGRYVNLPSKESTTGVTDIRYFRVDSLEHIDMIENSLNRKIKRHGQHKSS